MNDIEERERQHEANVRAWEANVKQANADAAARDSALGRREFAAAERERETEAKLAVIAAQEAKWTTALRKYGALAIETGLAEDNRLEFSNMKTIDVGYGDATLIYPEEVTTDAEVDRTLRKLRRIADVMAPNFGTITLDSRFARERTSLHLENFHNVKAIDLPEIFKTLREKWMAEIAARPKHMTKEEWDDAWDKMSAFANYIGSLDRSEAAGNLPIIEEFRRLIDNDFQDEPSPEFKAVRNRFLAIRKDQLRGVPRELVLQQSRIPEHPAKENV